MHRFVGNALLRSETILFLKRHTSYFGTLRTFSRLDGRRFVGLHLHVEFSISFLEAQGAQTKNAVPEPTFSSS